MKAWIRKNRKVVLVMLLAAIALGAWGYRRFRRSYGWPPPENTGDWAGSLVRPSPGYDPTKGAGKKWINRPDEVPAGTTYHTYRASSIHGQATDYLIYLPPGYADAANAQRRYPVIYWFHGFYSEPQHGIPFVEGLEAAIRAGKAPPAIVVLPNGLPYSWYVDSVDASMPVESVIVKDLIPHIDATYRTIADRTGRAVEGFSMGGWGALHMALKYPELFCAATSISGPFHSHVSFPQLWPCFSNRKEAYYAEDPVTRARRNADQLRDRVRIRLTAGADDWTIVFARPLSQRLNEWKIPHEFRILPGVKHDAADSYHRMGLDAFEFYKAVFGPARE